jgi:catechol 2,3-dioxygenase-like lactoylglutathione lyase family enzyme
LGPFDYENARRTSGLWVAEGLTNYFNSLLVVRSGLCSTQEYLAALSAHIGQLQRAPGRLQQSLAASSLDTWTGSGFGRGASATSISYYTKGPVVGLLLDAKIRRATNGQRSLDDVMRLAYSRYAGEVGYTEQQFLDTCSEVAGVDLNEFFDKALFSTEELDYSEALDWFGLRFRPSEDESEDEAQPSWRLEMLPDATDEQRLRMVAYLAPSRAPINVAAVAAAAAASAGDAAPAGGAAPADDVMPAGAQGLPAPLVDGIGGVFIYSNDAPRLAAWYEQQLGFRGTKIEEDGAFIFAFKHRPLDSPDTVTETVWAILPAVEPRASDPPQYSINYRVGSMERVLDHLRAGGVTIENAVDYPYGRFAWIRDPDGNRVELFEKPKP